MIGIDSKIEIAKARILNKLPKLTAYGRAIVNERENGSIPEVLVDGTNQYKDVLLDSSIPGQFFFTVDNDETVVDGRINTSTVNMYFAVNLVKLYPSVQERATEYLHRDIQNALKNTKFAVTGIVRNRESFSDFADEYVKIGDNMQPYYLCKFITEIEYNINEC